MIRKLLASTLLASAFVSTTVMAGEETQLYWGDTHLHTSNSFDAFLNGNVTADPDTAYRWAEGKPVIHPYHRAWVQIDRPLDFLVVSDHAEMMGVMPAIRRGEDLPEVGFIDSIKRWYVVRTLMKAIDKGEGPLAFAAMLPDSDGVQLRPDQVADQVSVANPFGDLTEIEQSTWDSIAETADRHYKPGKFTALIGWEWSSMPGGANLHRVVMSSTDGETAKQFLPYGSDDSQYPEDLWNWLTETNQRTGAEFIAIPHNSNVSKGYMFAETTLRGEKINSAYAKLRSEIEPIVEITQIKGDSETWPSISPDDQFADFEPFTRYLEQNASPYKAHKADFIRPALMRGLEIENQIGANPYKFGVIGSTDAHTGIASADSDNFHGKMPKDSTPEGSSERLFGDDITGWSMSASGYAAVWAKENTREEIFAAFKRRETYATTGPRITLRVFGGFDLNDDMAGAEDMAAQGYAAGVPMGGDLVADAAGRPVKLAIRAAKDPMGANLDRVQVVKGWLDADGQSHEKIYDVVWGAGVGGARAPDANGALPAVGNSVDLATTRYSNDIGAAELTTVWTDPDFDASQRAFYYVRVLEIPTPRHSLYDSIALKQAELPDYGGQPTIQERAYSSAIWYAPN